MAASHSEMKVFVNIEALIKFVESEITRRAKKEGEYPPLPILAIDLKALRNESKKGGEQEEDKFFDAVEVLVNRIDFYLYGAHLPKDFSKNIEFLLKYGAIHRLKQENWKESGPKLASALFADAATLFPKIFNQSPKGSPRAGSPRMASSRSASPRQQSPQPMPGSPPLRGSPGPGSATHLTPLPRLHVSSPTPQDRASPTPRGRAGSSPTPSSPSTPSPLGLGQQTIFSEANATVPERKKPKPSSRQEAAEREARQEKEAAEKAKQHRAGDPSVERKGPPSPAKKA